MNIPILAITAVLLVLLVGFLIWKNKKDRKELNPGSQDAVEETHRDQEQKQEKL